MHSIYIRLLFFIAFVNLSFSQQTLEYTFNVGDSIKVSQHAIQDISQDLNGVVHDMKNTLTGNFLFVVTSISDSSYVMNFRFESFKMLSYSNQMGNIIDVDTSREFEEDDVQAKIFSGLVESELELEMLKNGKILYIDGTESLINKMIARAGSFDAFTMELMKESMKKEFGSERLSESFEQMTYFYPNHEVNVGDTWDNEFHGALSAENTWILYNADENISIKGKSDIVMNTRDESVSMLLTGTMDTELTADKKTGFLIEMLVKSTAKGHTTMNQMNNIEVPTTITTNTTYKIEH